ncbi:MAG: hypothetical protein IPM16_20790 [Chloroflexi bacterium]|nr:hypothetical protein [Chloroflexota bacterium]
MSSILFDPTAKSTETQVQIQAMLMLCFSDIESIAEEHGGGLSEGETCAVHLPEFGVDGTGNYTITGAGPGAPHPHGEIVNAAILNAVAAYAPDKLEISSLAVPEDYFIGAFDTSLSDILGIEVIHVDVQSYDLDVINQQIAGYLDGTTRPELGDIPWIVNASFAVVPCSEIATLEAYTDALFALDALIDDANPAKIVVFQHVVKTVTERVKIATEAGGNLCGAFVDGSNVFVNPDAESGSCGYLKELISQANVFIAAAGNAGLEYPFYPASEPAVVSVSATAEDVPFLAFQKALNCVTDSDGNPLCSNWGEVLMPGQVTYQGDTYFGTSFAAPRLSLRLAVYLARFGANECQLMTEPFDNVLLRVLPYITLSTVQRQCGELNQVRWNVFKD